MPVLIDVTSKISGDADGEVAVVFRAAPPNVGEAETTLVPPSAAAAAGTLSTMIRQLHSNTLYRVSVMAETEAGPGTSVFVDGKTLPAARESTS